MTSSRPARPPVRRLGAGGMTLLELTVALSLFSLAVGGIYAFIVTGGRSARVTNNFVQAQTQMRAALDSVIDEARWAQRLVAAGPTSVTLLIRCDPRLSPPAPCGPYTVTFAYNAAGATLTRQVDPDAAGPLPAGPAAPLAYRILREDGTAGFAIEYFDGTGASLGASPADLTLVTRLRLTVDATDGIVSRTFAGDVALRER